MILKWIAAALFVVGQGKLISATHDQSHWELKADIYPDDPAGLKPALTPDHGFGWSIDYSADTLIAGSYRVGKWDASLNDGAGGYPPGGGSARVFVRSDPSSNAAWEQQGPPLVVSDGGKEYVGYRVAINGDRVIVVAGRGEGFGVVKMFVFERVDGTWAQMAILEFPDAYNDNGEMPRVALEGDIVVIGRPYPTTGIGSGTATANGKVFIYKKTAGSWGAPEEIEAPEGEKKDGDYFGVDVAISNGVLLVGADEREAWDSGTNNYQAVRKGKAFVFVDNNDGAGYVHSKTLEPDAAVPDGFRFGSYLALDGDNALIGNFYQGCVGAVCGCAGENVPSVYYIKRNSEGVWEQTFTYSSHACGYGQGVALKENQGLISDGGGHLRLIDLNDPGSNVDFYPQWRSSESSFRNGNWLALGSGEVFTGNDRSYPQPWGGEGSVHVYDNFSEVPLGEEILTYISSKAWGTSFGVSYEAGRGHPVEVELFKSDCTTSIENGRIIGGRHYTSEKSFTDDVWDFTYDIYDVTRLDELGIYNQDTWQIEICHKARLVSTPAVEDVRTLMIDVDLKPKGVVAGSFGDPHIMTFDKLKFDCQAAGVFMTLTSLDDDTFKIQERFTAVSTDTCSQASVSTGVAVTDTGKPTIQISTPRYGGTSLNTVNGCPIDFFVNGTESVLGEPDLSGSNVVVKKMFFGSRGDDDTRIKIIHTDTLLTVEVGIRPYMPSSIYPRWESAFGCHFTVSVGLPDTYRTGETLLGLLGTPNGDMTDDWVALDGSSIEAPATEVDRLFSTTYNYCVDNWCIQASVDSLFTLRSGETFDDINQCGVAYSGDIETAVRGLIDDPSTNQDLYDFCSIYGGSTLSLSCVVDGICGSIGDAWRAFNDQWNIDSINEETKSSEFSPLEPSSPAWEVKADIQPDDSTDFTPALSPDDGFGWSLGVSGETLIVGSFNSAMFDWGTQSYGPGQGSARVFRRVDNSNLSWEQVQDPLIVADPINPSAKYFGYRVAIDGTTALIAATREANGVKKSKIFVFELSANDVWEQTAIFPVEMLDDGETPRVALQGDLAICSQPYLGNGRVFVFKKLETWTVVATLQASDGQPGDYFGADVSISGNKILIGASQQDLKDTFGYPAQVCRGKAYIFVNHDDGNGWIEEAIILGDQYASEQLQFGAAVSLDGDTAFIGHGNFGVGHAYVYHQAFGNWALQEKLSAPRTSCDSWTFGKSVAVLGDLAIVGGESGEATLFERKRRSGWSVKSMLRGFKWNSSSRLGRTVALGSNFAVVGGDKGAGQLGAVDVFDDFSVAPPGAVDVIFQESWTSGNGIWATYLIGRDQNHTPQLFQKDCMTPIRDTSITIEPWLYTMNFTYDSVNFGYTLDRNTVRDSEIFNSTSSEIEVCHVVTLTDVPDKVSKQVIRIFVPPPNRFGGLFGDPHIMTFDEVSFDCQAAGEFTTLTSLEDPTFKIQERFTAIESDAGSDAGTCAQASVSTGVVVADTDKPKIQISTPRSGGTSLNTVNQCPIDFYINGTASVLGTDLSSSNIEVTLDEGSNRIAIKHTDTLLALNVVVGKSESFGCHVMVSVGLPGTFRSDETLLGLLGTPNGNKDDDWRTPEGIILSPPTTDAERLFSTAYNYCVDNWCAQVESESLFTYGAGESFAAINKCDMDFSSAVETAVNDQDKLDQNLVTTCGGNLICLVDGLCGDIADALAAMGSQEEIMAAQVEVKSASVFPQERVNIQNVESIQPVTTTTTSSTASSSTTTSSSTSNGSSTTTSSSTSNGSSMNRWYPNWGNTEQTCKNDGNYQPYMETGNYIKKTLEECCKAHYWWASDECLVLGGDDLSQVGSGEFYVDYESLSCKQSCFERDSSAAKNCGGLAPKWTETFKKAEDCCANKLFWVNKEACVAASTSTDLADSDRGSKKWYVDWITYKCVKDCVKGADEHCGGIAQVWDQTFETSAECCKTKLHWLRNSECTGQGNVNAV